MSKWDKYISRAAPILAFLGIGGVIVQLPGLFNRLEVRSWSSTDGRIVDRETIDSMPSARRGSGEELVAITYKFSVSGETYDSRKVYPGVATAYRKEKLSGLRSGQQVTVYYNPNNPSEAVLRRYKEGRLSYLIFWALMLPVPGYVYGRMIYRRVKGLPAKWWV